MTDDKRDLTAIQRAMSRLRERHELTVRRHMRRFPGRDPKEVEDNFQRAVCKYNPDGGRSFATWLEMVLDQGGILEYRRRALAEPVQKRSAE